MEITDMNPGDPFQHLAESFPRLSDGQQRVAQALLDRPADTVFLSTAALGRQVGVSDSTVVRLAAALGYSGYPELREAVRGSLFKHVTPSEQFRRALWREGESPAGSSIKEDTENVSSLDVEVVHGAIARAVVTLASADDLYVAGSHASFAPAFLLYHLVSQVRANTHLIGGTQGDAHLKLLGASSRSAIVAFSLPRYSRETFRVAKLAADMGAQLIPVSDSATSPLAQLNPSMAINVSCQSASFFHSQSASIAVVNALVAGVAKELRADARGRLKRLERVMTSLDRLLERSEDSSSRSDHEELGGDREPELAEVRKGGW